MGFTIVFILLLVIAYMALDAMITALEIIVPFAILLALGIGVIAALWSCARSRLAKTVIAVSVLLIVYGVGTPTGAVRTAVLFSGHPIKAVMLRVRKANEEELEMENWKETKNATLYHVTKNAPRSADEDHTRDMWTASRRVWLFFTARYYGETERYLVRKELSELQRAQEARPFTVYRAYEDFTVHGIYVPEGTVVVLETMGEGRTGIVIYGKDDYGQPLRTEDVLLNTELPKAGPGEFVGPWAWNLPLSTPHLKHENNSGVSITPQLYAALDPEWSQDPNLSYEEIETLVFQINAINRKK